jgi:transposase
MEDLPDPDPRNDRIAQAGEHLREARKRASQAQERLILARERLARARQALSESRTSGVNAPGPDIDPTALDEPP